MPRTLGYVWSRALPLALLALPAASVHLRGLDRVDMDALDVVACERLVGDADLGDRSRKSHLVARFVGDHTVAGGVGAGVAAGRVMVGVV